MTAPDPRDLLTAALIATDRHARLHERWIHGGDITHEQMRASQDACNEAQRAAYVAVERAVSELGAAS